MNPQQSPSPRGLSADAFSSLFQAIGGLRNVRAAVAMLSCLLVAALIAGLLATTGLGEWARNLAALVFFVGYLAGFNAAGILLLDQARGVHSRGLVDALIYALICVPKLILLVLLMVVVSALIFLALAVLLFVCKMPGLGPVLFVAVFPLCVVVAGAAICWLLLGGNLAWVALLDGATVIRAIAQSIAIARTRLMESALLQAVVALLSIVVGMVIFVVLGIGFLPTAAMSLSIVGNVGGGNIGSVLTDFGSAGAYAIAGAVGTGVLWAVAATLVTLVAILGIELVYLRVTEGLDSTAAEQALTDHMNTARRRAAELGEKARAAGERAREQAGRATPVAAFAAVAQVHEPSQAPPSVRLASVCPQCRKPITDQDVFCGECGFRMT